MVKVTIYTTDNCAKCKMAKIMLQSKNVKFEEKNLKEDDVMLELVCDNAQLKTVPIIKFDNEFIYDLNVLNKILEGEK